MKNNKETLNNIKSIKELVENEVLCDYCFCTDFGTQKVNTNPKNMCFGEHCEETYEDYIYDEYGEKIYDSYILINKLKK
jgi:hypothetical protein